MTLTILLDLDDTLLKTNLDTFIPAYFQALAKHLAAHVPPEQMISALIAGTRRMNENADPACTLQAVFDAEFYPRLGVPKEELSDEIERFYDEVFPRLSSFTEPVAEASAFVDWAFSRGYRLAVATEPFFPRKATYHRLRWAGLDPARFELVSTYDHFRFSKNHVAYYAEVLGRMGWPDGPVLMVGDNLERDILPAQRLGLATYHIIGEPDGRGLTAQARGSLTDLRRWLAAADLDRLVPLFKMPDAILAILLASPAALAGLAAGIGAADWSHQPALDEWALIEVVCHLRDTEREIHPMQIRLFDEQPEPFIPRPDTTVWASQRNYLNENGPAALIEFMRARLETLSMLKNITEAGWARRARHAIFGPTDFLEVAGFMADHDRMHIQQAWKILHHRY